MDPTGGSGRSEPPKRPFRGIVLPRLEIPPTGRPTTPVVEITNRPGSSTGRPRVRRPREPGGYGDRQRAAVAARFEIDHNPFAEPGSVANRAGRTLPGPPPIPAYNPLSYASGVNGITIPHRSERANHFPPLIYYTNPQNQRVAQQYPSIQAPPHHDQYFTAANQRAFSSSTQHLPTFNHTATRGQQTNPSLNQQRAVTNPIQSVNTYIKNSNNRFANEKRVDSSLNQAISHQDIRAEFQTRSESVDNQPATPIPGRPSGRPRTETVVNHPSVHPHIGYVQERKGSQLSPPFLTPQKSRIPLDNRSVSTPHSRVDLDQRSSSARYQIALSQLHTTFEQERSVSLQNQGTEADSDRAVAIQPSVGSSPDSEPSTPPRARALADHEPFSIQNTPTSPIFNRARAAQLSAETKTQPLSTQNTQISSVYCGARIANQVLQSQTRAPKSTTRAPAQPQFSSSRHQFDTSIQNSTDIDRTLSPAQDQSVSAIVIKNRINESSLSVQNQSTTLQLSTSIVGQHSFAADRVEAVASRSPAIRRQHFDQDLVPTPLFGRAADQQRAVTTPVLPVATTRRKDKKKTRRESTPGRPTPLLRSVRPEELDDYDASQAVAPLNIKAGKQRVQQSSTQSVTSLSRKVASKQRADLPSPQSQIPAENPPRYLAPEDELRLDLETAIKNSNLASFAQQRRLLSDFSQSTTTNQHSQVGFINPNENSNNIQSTSSIPQPLTFATLRANEVIARRQYKQRYAAMASSGPIPRLLQNTTNHSEKGPGHLSPAALKRCSMALSFDGDEAASFSVVDPNTRHHPSLMTTEEGFSSHNGIIHAAQALSPSFIRGAIKLETKDYKDDASIRSNSTARPASVVSNGTARPTTPVNLINSAPQPITADLNVVSAPYSSRPNNLDPSVLTTSSVAHPRKIPPLGLRRARIVSAMPSESDYGEVLNTIRRLELQDDQVDGNFAAQSSHDPARVIAQNIQDFEVSRDFTATHGFEDNIDGPISPWYFSDDGKEDNTSKPDDSVSQAGTLLDEDEEHGSDKDVNDDADDWSDALSEGSTVVSHGEPQPSLTGKHITSSQYMNCHCEASMGDPIVYGTGNSYSTHISPAHDQDMDPDNTEMIEGDVTGAIADKSLNDSNADGGDASMSGSGSNSDDSPGDGDYNEDNDGDNYEGETPVEILDWTQLILELGGSGRDPKDLDDDEALFSRETFVFRGTDHCHRRLADREDIHAERAQDGVYPIRRGTWNWVSPDNPNTPTFTVHQDDDEDVVVPTHDPMYNTDLSVAEYALANNRSLLERPVMIREHHLLQILWRLERIVRPESTFDPFRPIIKTTSFLDVFTEMVAKSTIIWNEVRGLVEYKDPVECGIHSEIPGAVDWDLRHIMDNGRRHWYVKDDVGLFERLFTTEVIINIGPATSVAEDRPTFTVGRLYARRESLDSILQRSKEHHKDQSERLRELVPLIAYIQDTFKNLKYITLAGSIGRQRIWDADESFSKVIWETGPSMASTSSKVKQDASKARKIFHKVGKILKPKKIPELRPVSRLRRRVVVTKGGFVPFILHSAFRHSLDVIRAALKVEELRFDKGFFTDHAKNAALDADDQIVAAGRVPDPAEWATGVEWKDIPLSEMRKGTEFEEWCVRACREVYKPVRFGLTDLDNRSEF